MKFKVYKYESLPSTNDRAIQFIKDKNVKFGYIHSEMQTSGRGAHGKRWVSIKGNFFGSIFFPLKENYPTFHEFSFISPVLVYNVIKSFCENCNLALKWPNDILISKNKICGILQEVVKKNNLSYLIIGIGINLINDQKIKKIKTSNIFKETNIKIKKEDMIKKIIKSYENFFSKINQYKFDDYKEKANFLSIKPSELKWN